MLFSFLESFFESSLKISNNENSNNIIIMKIKGVVNQMMIMIILIKNDIKYM